MASVFLHPDRHRAVIFDLDGVVTETAGLHFRAWKRLFDDFLEQRRPDPNEDTWEFTEDDYRRHVDGKPREKGVSSFLASRGIELPEGDVDDPEDRNTVHGLGNRKNHYFRKSLEEQGVTVFDSTVDLVRDLQDADVGTAVISASRNCQLVLEIAGLGDLFPVRVDGVVADELGLPGKPDPAVFVEAARRLDASPADAVVVEDALAGVRAGAAHEFALVVGVDRSGRPDRMRESGADVVVADLSDVAVCEDMSDGHEHGSKRPLSRVPDALEDWEDVLGMIDDRSPVFFFDFDGTLAPIVDDPADAEISDGTRSVLDDLATVAPIAIVSGRDLRDVRERTALDDAWFAGSHGFEIAGPDGTHHRHPAAENALPALDDAEQECRRRIGEIDGAAVDRKKYALAVHYRQIADDGRIDDVIDAAREVAETNGLRVTEGRKIVELRPAIDWHKGKAVDWLLDAMVPDRTDTVAVYVGDDITDEDALAEVRTNGLGIVVRAGADQDDDQGDRRTHAHFAVDGTDALRQLLERFSRHLRR